MAIGFIGLGRMGLPMAANLAAHHTGMRVWNRTPERAGPLLERGAVLTRTVAELLGASDVVFLMLSDGAATDEVLGRGTERMSLLADRTVVQLGTTAPAYSAGLAADVRSSGGRYVEAPVSGSRQPAEQGRLVAMLAGDGESVATVRPLLEPMCHESVVVGPVPRATELKLAVNAFLITQVVGLAEAFCLARRRGLDPELLRAVLDAGPVASPVARTKLTQLIEADFAARAAVSDVRYNTDLIVETARGADLQLPLLEEGRRLFLAAEYQGLGHLDMAAVAAALDAALPVPAEPVLPVDAAGYARPGEPVVGSGR